MLPPMLPLARLLPAASRSLALLALCAMMFACAKPEVSVRQAVEAPLAQEVWDRFCATSERAAQTAGPFRVNATLHYSGKEDSQRVTVYFWGNGQRENPLPLRLDILMGPGSVMANALEDARGLFIYVPRDEAVYHAQGARLARFGVPVPFSLADLAALLTGNYAAVFGDDAGLQKTAPPAVRGEDGAIAYAVTGVPLAGELVLSPDGLVSAWYEDRSDGWSLTVDYWPDSTRTTPRKLYVRHGETGAEATLIVRELTFPQTPFSNEQLRLNAPPNTRLAPLAVAQ